MRPEASREEGHGLEYSPKTRTEPIHGTVDTALGYWEEQ